MDARIESYLEAARTGAQWLLAQQNDDGSFIRPDLQADVYHKTTLALTLSGHPVAANRLLSWIRTNDLQADGQLHHFSYGLGLYKTSWVVQGAHRLGRFDISLPVMGYVLRLQAPCGGFFQSPQGTEFVEPICTSWAGVAAIYTGHPEAAERAAGCLAEMVAQQPEEMRFYSRMTPHGKLVTGDDAPFVDATRTEQPYYCPGIAMLFLAKLHQATGAPEHLQVAEELFEFTLRCAEDAYAYPTAGKSGLGAATLYAITGDERARDAACSLADYLVREQKEEGWWCNPHSDTMIVRLDHTAEFIIWLSEMAAALGGAPAADES